MELTFELDPNEILKWSQSKQSELPQRAYRLTFDVSNDLRNGMMDTTPVRCGFNKNSHVADVVSWDRGLVYSDAPYYPYIIKGRGPITAKQDTYLGTNIGRPHALRFRIGGKCSGGTFIYRKSVGPMKANDYRPRAIQKAQGDIKGHLDEFAAWYAK